ncbi:DUF305 domain-containing protein [Streptomyces monticola]|uniref:DUF305 domain-containing protein n=1 Tax=Streptomyces monticola TaxID=2666263 RepID=A0ABW2JGT5_9ACTN
MPNRRGPLSARSVTAAVAVVLAFALTGCDSSGDDAQNKGGKQAGPSVIAPGKPGEEAKKLSPEEAAKKHDDDTPNSADFTYAQMMIEHHAQALTMTELAPDRAESTRVKRLAERIKAGQGPEIDAMKGWIKNNGGKEKAEEDGGSGGHEHGHSDAPMPGMATAAQLKTLRAAEGKAFDELFLKLMITHHNGAVTMATEVLSEGNNILIEEMANDVIAQQTSEINRMRGMS